MKFTMFTEYLLCRCVWRVGRLTFPESVEASIQLTLTLPCVTPGIICTLWKSLARITISHPAAYTWNKHRFNNVTRFVNVKKTTYILKLIFHFIQNNKLLAVLHLFNNQEQSSICSLLKKQTICVCETSWI